MLTENEWWKLAVDEPLLAMHHPLYSLITLGDLDRWLAFEAQRAPLWVAMFASPASTKYRPDSKLIHLWAFDCLSHIAETYFASDPLPPQLVQSIEARKRVANEEISEQEASDIYITCADAREETSIKAPLWYFADALIHGSSYEATQFALTAVDENGAAHQEAVWQWRRLVWHLGGCRD